LFNALKRAGDVSVFRPRDFGRSIAVRYRLTVAVSVRPVANAARWALVSVREPRRVDFFATFLLGFLVAFFAGGISRPLGDGHFASYQQHGAEPNLPPTNVENFVAAGRASYDRQAHVNSSEIRELELSLSR
jgi:hypothetical protein